MFTVDVTIRENHKIKKDGLYKILRHPAYSGMIISFIGFGLSLNNWISFLVVAIPITSVMILRIKAEEASLLKQFGNEYSDYIKTTYRLMPWVY
jgi:protein-S-isoprenylcysteine O-methyltransferase Ste14